MQREELIKQYEELYGEINEGEEWRIDLAIKGERTNHSIRTMVNVPASVRKCGHFPLFPDGSLVTSSGLNYLIPNVLDAWDKPNIKLATFKPGIIGYVVGHAFHIEQSSRETFNVANGLLQQKTLDLHYKLLMPALHEEGKPKPLPGHDFFWARFDWVELVDLNGFDPLEQK